MDADGVEAYARENRVDAIYSVGSDIAMPTVCRVAERLGLAHFVTSETADVCRAKPRMRDALRGSAYQVHYVLCRRLEDARDIDFYPVMMKPADSQGQRGVYRCRDYAEVARYFGRSMAHSRCGALILERYIPGNEVSFNGYMHHGELIFGLMSDRESFDAYPGGIVKGHRLPSMYRGTKAEERVLSLVREAVDRLKIHDGPVYFQIMIHDGWPYLLEVTPRLDGCHMWKLIELYAGVDLLDMALRHLLGGEIAAPVWRPRVEAARTEFVCRAPGTAFAAEPDEGVPAAARDYYREGEIVRPINGYMEKCGYRMYVRRTRVALIGGSGVIGGCFRQMYGAEFDLIDVSRGTGAIAAYTRDAIAERLSGCDAAVILAAQKVREGADYSVNGAIARESVEACCAAGVKRVVLLSTRCVYDPAAKSPWDEDAPVSPVNAYGQSKREAEQICHDLCERYAVRLHILRLAQVLSARDGTTAFATFLRAALAGENLTVYDGGERDYVDVRDVCRAIALTLRTDAPTGIYNIGSGVSTSVARMAEAIAREAGVRVIDRRNAARERTSWRLDIAKARRLLGFSPIYTIETTAAEQLAALKREAAKDGA